MARRKGKLFKEKIIRTIVFTNGVEDDLNEIGEWYGVIRKGLKEDFLLSVEVEVEIIRRAPLIYKEYCLNIKKSIISKFPYGLYYILESEQIIVLAIIHQKRGKRAIKKKIKQGN